MPEATYEQTAYQEQGYLVVPEVVDAALVDEARRHIGWLMEQNPGVRPEHLGHTLMRDDPFWVRLVSDERILDVAERFIGPDIALFASHYIAKPPGEGLPVLWHQDAGYWPLDPMEVVTVWLALDDSGPDNGCVRVIPGSHLWDVKPLRANSATPSVLGSEIDVDPGLIDESQATDLVVPAGGVSVHHPNIVHSSHANTSSRWRRGLTIRYIPTTTRIVSDRQWPAAFLLRGSAVDGVNIYLPWPRYVEGMHFPFAGCDAWR